MTEKSKKRRVKQTTPGRRVNRSMLLIFRQIASPIKTLLSWVWTEGSTALIFLAVMLLTMGGVYYLVFSLTDDTRLRSANFISVVSLTLVFVFAYCVRVFLAFRANRQMLLMNKVKEREKSFFDEINKGVSSLLTEKLK